MWLGEKPRARPVCSPVLLDRARSRRAAWGAGRVSFGQGPAGLVAFTKVLFGANLSQASSSVLSSGYVQGVLFVKGAEWAVLCKETFGVQQGRSRQSPAPLI